MKNNELKQAIDYMIERKIDNGYGWKVTGKSLVYTDMDKQKHIVPLTHILNKEEKGV